MAAVDDGLLLFQRTMTDFSSRGASPPNTSRIKASLCCANRCEARQKAVPLHGLTKRWLPRQHHSDLFQLSS